MKIVAISDTHWRPDIYNTLPSGDVLVIAGDYSDGSLVGLLQFNRTLERLLLMQYQHIVFVPGNHNVYEEENPTQTEELFSKNPRLHYLVDTECTIDGIKFYGTPWSVEFNNWAFMLDEERLSQKFSNIPMDTDILITHTPPFGILDNIGAKHLGSHALETRILKVKPKIHFFGHIHEAHGSEHSKYTDFYNVSILNDNYVVEYKPTVVEL